MLPSQGKGAAKGTRPARLSTSCLWRWNQRLRTVETQAFRYCLNRTFYQQKIASNAHANQGKNAVRTC